MSTIGFVTGLKALYAAQLSMQTAGHNIANAHVEGFSRQNVLVATDNPISLNGLGFLGTGVKATAITRAVDTLLENRIRLQSRGMGRLDKKAFILSQVEGMFNEPSDGGLAAQFSQFFATLNSMALDPTDPTLRSDVVQSASLLTEGFNLLAVNINALREDLEYEIENKLEKVNELASDITKVSQMIVASESGHMDANELQDRRNQLLKELNSYVDADVSDDGKGNISVLLDGRMLASNTYTGHVELSSDASGELYVHLANDSTPIRIRDGEIHELLDQQANYLPEMTAKLDALAGHLAYEFNKIHSKGIPLSGAFTYLKASQSVKDLNYDQIAGNEILLESGLPFPPQAGSLFVSVTDTQTGAVEQTEITIDPERDSLRQIAQSLTDIAHLNAYVDSKGKLNLQASSGFTFDFAPRLDPNPDPQNTFGGEAAMIAGSDSYPVTLNAGDSFVIAENGVNLPAVTFAGGSYSASQMATEINSQTGLDLASVVDGRLVIRSITPPGAGMPNTLQITDASGTPSAALGLSTTLETGSDKTVNVTLSGAYNGSTNTQWRFEASGTGTIGVTPNLTVTVYNEEGDQVAILDVGEGYSPGDMIEVGDGVEVSFTPGDISDGSGDFFTAKMIADSDTSGFLASVGLNTFFDGFTASDLSVRSDILDSPGKIAAALSDQVGDNLNALNLAGMENLPIEALGSNSAASYYSILVGDLGIDKEQADYLFEVQDLLMTNLENQRASVSGVSIDEELLNLEKYQQMLDAATRYLQVLSEVSDTLMTIGL